MTTKNLAKIKEFDYKAEVVKLLEVIFFKSIPYLNSLIRY